MPIRITPPVALPPDCTTRLTSLRKLLQQHADPVHAAFHQGYHKSTLRFAGLRTPQLKVVWREVWPTRERLSREDALPLIGPLWDSGCFEETATATYLLSRIVKLLTADDLPLLLDITRRCTGWAQLDFFALEVLGPLALLQGPPVYKPVAAWINDDWLWTRRAAIMVHVIPARGSKLDDRYAWPSFAARLFEKEFFIRKAIGWALRECCKHYPEQVVSFVNRHAAAMAGLTRREATRNLPEDQRADLT